MPVRSRIGMEPIKRNLLLFQRMNSHGATLD
jgi:hypothetical protein